MRSKNFPIDLLLENGVSMLAHSFLIESSSKLLVTRTGIKSSNKFRFRASGFHGPFIYVFLK